MARLSTTDQEACAADIMSGWSRNRTVTPMTRDEITALVADYDAALSVMETDVINGLDPSDSKTWLDNNPTRGREIAQCVINMRREVL